MRNIYFIRTRKTNKIYASAGAYTSLPTAKLALGLINKVYARKYNECIDDNDLYIDTCEVDGTISRLMYYFTVYTGFDYSAGGIHDVDTFNGHIYSCMESLKNSPLYKLYMDKVLSGSPDDYIIKDDGSFGNRDGFDNIYLFRFGDIMEGKFSVNVGKIRVFKGAICNKKDLDILFDRLYKNI